MLVAYDGSPGSQAALRLGVALVQSLGTDLQSVSVKEHLPRYAASIDEVEGAKERIDEHFHALTKGARDEAALAGVELETIVRTGHEVDEILQMAREGEYDLLLLGSHGHSRVVERLIGSTSLSVARLAPCSVMIVRWHRPAPPALDLIRRIVVGLDGSPLGRLAFRVALDLATLCQASVAGVTVEEASPLAREEPSASRYVQQLAAAATEHARAAGIAFEHLARQGHAAESLRVLARATSADLVVLGATGLEHPWSGSIGGTAGRVVSEAACSVLLVRSPQAVRHVRDVMVRSVSTVTPETLVAEVVELLLRRDVKALPVVDDHKHPVGIITGGDLLERGGLDLRLSAKREMDPDALGEHLRALAASRRSAREVMTRHVRSIDVDTDLHTAIEVMARHRVKRLPVVNERGELVGIVSRADILRAIAALPDSPPAARERALPTGARSVAEAAITEVPVVPPDTPADEVLATVLKTPLRRVVVAESDGVVLGLISDRDLLARSSPDVRSRVLQVLRGRRTLRRPAATGTRRGVRGGPLTAADLMAPSLITVQPNDSLTHAIRLMMQHRVKRLVVVDGDGRFRGLVDRREILRLLAGEQRS
jgi:nucleotide-binding universal stress UspA family protein/CBS domain containing-hemolysin-like protein